jgi:DNA-directed RNA polymerase subunit alpha
MIRLKKLDSIRNSQDNNIYGKFSILPLTKGHGLTVGNALRRTLLSDLSGIAITALKIGGVEHEFSLIPGVREDLLEILLNLKQIVFTGTLTKETIVTVNVNGPKIITANDILLPDNLKIVNPTQYIAVISSNVQLTMELKISSGTGYKLANSNSIKTGTDFIEIDAVFTPIQRINYYVENIYTKPRLLKENLIFEVWTNGSITPECAVKNASEILINLLSIFISPSQTSEQNLVLENKTNISLEELNLSVRAYNCLKSAQINSLEDLMQYSLKDLEKIKSFGQKSLVEVVTKLKNNYGIILKN